MLVLALGALGRYSFDRLHRDQRAIASACPSLALRGRLAVPRAGRPHLVDGLVPAS